MCGCGSKSIAQSPKVGCGCGGASRTLGAVKKDCGCGCGGSGGCGGSATTLGATKTVSVLRGVNQGYQYAPTAIPKANEGANTTNAIVGVATLGLLCLGLTFAVQKIAH